MVVDHTQQNRSQHKLIGGEIRAFVVVFKTQSAAASASNKLRNLDQQLDDGGQESRWKGAARVQCTDKRNVLIAWLQRVKERVWEHTQ